MNSKVILFTGLVRDEVKFLHLLTHAKNHSEGRFRILYSTWLGELNRYPQLRNWIIEHDIDVFEAPQPNLLLPGHMMHQTLAIMNGLALCKDTDLVLKTRPDLGTTAIINSFMSLDYEKAKSGKESEMQFFVDGFFPSQPMYIGDTSIAATAKSLFRACMIPIISLTIYSNPSPEQLFWHHMFVPKSSPIEYFLRVAPGFVFNHLDIMKRVQDRLIDSNLYVAALAAYFSILKKHFHLFSREHDEDLQSAAPSWTLEALLWSDLGAKGVRHHPGCFSNIIQSHALISALADGKFGSSKFGDTLKSALSDGFEASSLDLGSLSVALGRENENEQTFSRRMKYINKENDVFIRRGDQYACTTVAGASDRVAMLEDEIARLKRANEALVGKIVTLEKAS